MDREKPFIHLFRTPGGYYIYDINTNSIVRTQKEVYELLLMEQKECFINDVCSEKQVKDTLIEKMKKNGLLSSKRVKEMSHPANSKLEYYLSHKLRMLTLQVTQQCNLRCEYCAYSGNYLNRGHANLTMSFEIAKKGIDFLVNNSRDVDMIGISFYGGEPLLEFELIKKCINYSKSVSEGKTVIFNFTTNGTLFTKEIIEFLSQNEVNIMISLDGPKEIHDKNRKFAVSGCGTFEKVSKNLEFFRVNYPEYFKKVTFNMVLENKSDFCCVNDFYTTYDTIKDSMVNMTSVSENYAKFEDNKENIYDVQIKYERFKLLLSKINRLDISNVSKLVINYYEGLKKKVIEDREYSRELPSKAHHGGPCIPGAHRLFMDINGTFYPCEKVSESSEIMRIGHVDTGFDIEKVCNLLNIGKITENSCINCWAFRLCYLCAAAADDTAELSAERKQSQCNMVRASQEDLLKDYCTLIEFGHSFEDNNSNYVMEGIV